MRPHSQRGGRWSGYRPETPGVNGKCGYIDNRAQFRIPPEYDSCDAFSDGVALVTKENDTGTPDRHFIKINGQRAFERNISSFSNFSAGVALVEEEGRKIYIDKLGRTIRLFE